MISGTWDIVSRFIPEKERVIARNEIIAELKNIADDENVKTADDLARAFQNKYPAFFDWAKIAIACRACKINEKTSKWVTFTGMVLLISIIIAVIVVILEIIAENSVYSSFRQF